jgi:hypothetical protein
MLRSVCNGEKNLKNVRVAFAQVFPDTLENINHFCLELAAGKYTAPVSSNFLVDRGPA